MNWNGLQRTLPGRNALTRLADSPRAAFMTALALTALVAALDHLSGYELRLAVLYLAPIALATWIAGLLPGLSIVASSSLLWLASFASAHPYSHDLFFYWDGVVMIAVDLACVLLLVRLRAVLTRADQRFLNVLEELHAAVYVADQGSGKVLYANHSLALLIDADPYALGADDLAQRFGLAAAGHDLSPAAAAGRAGFASHEVREQASGRWYLVQSGPIPWKSARRVNVQVITEITEQRQAQALKRQHQAMLHQTSRLATLAEIASSLAHELNQPLMAITSYNDACLRMLGAGSFARSDLTAALQRCREQALRAGKIIGRVRDFIRSRRTTPSACDINALVRQSLELLETQLDDNEVSAELSLSTALPITRADPTLLVQVIVNLLLNAIDAMAHGAPTRRHLVVATGTGADGEIVVSVADQGDGIADAIGDQLYAPLFTTKSQGLGLGLAICRSVVEAHGGRIWHRPNADNGCTFYFTLPPEND